MYMYWDTADNWVVWDSHYNIDEEYEWNAISRNSCRSKYYLRKHFTRNKLDKKNYIHTYTHQGVAS